MFLVQLIPAGWQTKNLPLVSVADLARWAVESRYPDVGGTAAATLADAQAAVTFADQIVAAARQDLADHP